MTLSSLCAGLERHARWRIGIRRDRAKFFDQGKQADDHGPPLTSHAEEEDSAMMKRIH